MRNFSNIIKEISERRINYIRTYYHEPNTLYLGRYEFAELSNNVECHLIKEIQYRRYKKMDVFVIDNLHHINLTLREIQ